MHHLVLALSLFTAFQGAGPASAPKGRNPRTELIHWFEAKSADQQKKTLAALRAAVDGMDDPYLKSLRAYTAKAKETPLQRKGFSEKQKVSPDGSFPLKAELPFPLHVEYVYGAGILRKLDVAGAPAKPALMGDPGPVTKEMLTLLDGYVPDLDYALAEIMLEIDTDKSAEPFAMFLESWRNGDESFYRALDRTSGTKQDVFFYDAMLADFVERVVRTSGDTGSKVGLKQAHDDLHTAFLTYRQYRAMREAFALSVVLPPETKLPKNLRRYETAPDGSLSLRDEVNLMLCADHQDFGKLIDMLKKSALPVPMPLWSATYEPLKPFLDACFERSKSLTGGVDSMLAEQRKMRSELSKRVGETVRKKLVELGCTVMAHE